MIRVRKAAAGEARALSDLALRSKAVWGYSPEQMATFRGELTLEAGALAASRAHVLEDAGSIVGFFTLVSVDAETAELEHLFIEPDRLRRGFGSELFRHACEVARSEGFVRLAIQSDPNAAGFYQVRGAALLRHIPSSLPGRSIPYLVYPLR